MTAGRRGCSRGRVNEVAVETTRDFPISPSGPRVEIDAEGTWLVDGEPVVHPTILAELVARLGRRPDGRYVLRAAGGELPIGVAGAPFVVRTVTLARAPDGRVAAIRAGLSDGTEEEIDPASLRRLPRAAGEPPGERLACAVKAGRFEARFTRLATYQLLEAAEPTGDGRARLETVGGTIVV